MKKIPFILIFIILQLNLSTAQEKVGLNNYCNYFGLTNDSEQEIILFAPGQEALETISKIMSYTGLPQNFTVYNANIANAYATLEGDKRIILYDSEFMNILKSLNDWASISILAHEIGHHLSGHTLQEGGSRPNLELEADKFSGFLLHLMGASLQESQAALINFNQYYPSPTHPGLPERLAAIQDGWNSAKERIASTNFQRKSNQNNLLMDPETLMQIANKSWASTTFITRCYFNGDPVEYYINLNDEIIAVNPLTRQATTIGDITLSDEQYFKWMYTTPHVTYGIDERGGIWGRNQFTGNFIQVGYTAKIK